MWSTWAPSVEKLSFHALFAGRSSRHSPTNVQSTCWAGPRRVLHQSPTRCSGVFIALHKHGWGNVALSLRFTFWSSAFFPHNIISFHLQRNCRSGPNPSEAFRFLVEERIVCQQSNKAKYTQRVDYIIQLPVPMDQATNTGEGSSVSSSAHQGYELYSP